MSRRILIQVTAPAVILGLIMVGICIASLWSISQLQANLNSILAGNVMRLEAAADLEVKLRQLRFHTFMYVIDPTPNRQRLIEEDESGFEAALAILRNSSTDPEERRLVSLIAEGYTSYRSRLARTMTPAPEPRTRESYLEWADAHPVQPLLVPCQELMRLNREAMEATAQESERVGDRTRTAMIFAAILGPLGGLVAGFGIARGLSRSIAQLRVQVEDVRSQLTEDMGTVHFATRGGLDELEVELSGVVKRVRDVVEQAQQREREALRAEQLAAVGQLAAGVAHEVRNPLMSMKLLTEAAIAGGELNADDLRVIHEQIGRLEQTVTGLLDFARPTPPQREVADLRGIVAAAVDLVRGRAELQNVRIEFHGTAQAVLVLVDVTQLTGVIVNLLLNALDALPSGGSIEVALAQSDCGQVKLTVTDTGTGIAEDVRRRLFEPFVSTKDTGTGLGLNVCRRVIRDHSGDIGAENLPGGGARFTITLPEDPTHAETAGHRR